MLGRRKTSQISSSYSVKLPSTNDDGFSSELLTPSVTRGAEVAQLVSKL